MKLKHHFIVLLLALLGFQSCKKDSFTEKQAQTAGSIIADNLEGEGEEYHEGEIILGQQLQNPYLVQNMQQAYNTLTEQGNFDCRQIEVRPTHLYVKFKPQNLEQYEVLDADSTLNMQEYPIDFAVLQNGNSYHDPAVPQGQVTYQYASVKIDYNFIDSIPYEIIDTLYIPEEDERLVNDRNDDDNNPNIDCIDKLLDQAYFQTGNYEDMLDPGDYRIGGKKLKDSTKTNINQNNTAYRRPKYRPGGNIRIFDTRLAGNIGLEGARIKARRWFTTHNARPDFNGNFRMNRTFRRPCNYSLWFSTTRFAVRRHLVGTTHWINGPKILGDWNHTIADGYTRFEGHIFRGGYRYHHQNIDGLARPFRPNFQRQLFIGVDANKSWSGENYMVLPVIRIARYENGDGQEYDSDEIFSTACHETAHTSHVLQMNAGLIQYWQVDSQLQESWAVAIEWRLTHLEYANRGILNYGEWDYHPAGFPQYPNDQAYQYWTLNINPTYTSLFINLVDNINELNQPYFGWGLGSINDQVTGYTLSFIEQNILKHSYGIWSLSNELKSNKPTGVTDVQIDNLLSFY